MPITLMSSSICLISFAYSYLLISFVSLKPWWLDEPNAVDSNPPNDIPVSKGRLIIVDVNGVLLKSWSRLPKEQWDLEPQFQAIPVSKSCFCELRPDAQEFLETLAARAIVMIWSCSRKPKLMQILSTCFPKLMNIPIFFTGNE